MTSTLRDTPLRAVHERLGATMTDFAGWLMPLRYGGETAEHDAVRNSAALFDLSHMGEIAVTGPDAAAALDYAVCGWPSKLPVGGAGTGHRDLTHMRQVEQRGAGPDGVVLGGLAAVAQRHQPAGEVGHRRAEPLVHRLQRTMP